MHHPIQRNKIIIISHRSIRIISYFYPVSASMLDSESLITANPIIAAEDNLLPVLLIKITEFADESSVDNAFA